MTSDLLQQSEIFYLVEHHLFFRNFSFHKQKIAFHRASMKYYEQYVRSMGKEVIYLESASQEKLTTANVLKKIKKDGITQLQVYEPVDDWILRSFRKNQFLIELQFFQNPAFIETYSSNFQFFQNKQRFFQTEFYIALRKKYKILVNSDLSPTGGKWSYDADNRKRYPKNKLPPSIQFPQKNQFIEEAFDYTEKHFPDNIGELNSSFFYPIHHEDAKLWFKDFLDYRFHAFGEYEDALVAEETILHHSVLSPLINVGLLNPLQIVYQAIDYGEKQGVPMNSIEGFVRQILGWREFIRAVYELKGRQERTTNFWNHHRKIPYSFYDGTTGLMPVDVTIKKVLKTGYCHHIERLMVLGNIMLLCEFHPDEVYRWFMELFIDAYDWVMVPNVYGMSQFADGGLMSTKPYFSGSNYLLKMGNYPKGDWQLIWDGLFWRFLIKHSDYFRKNPRMAALLSTWEKFSEEKKRSLSLAAEHFLKQLDEVATV